MNSQTPSDEQVFDYFMGNLAPDTARLVSAYLAIHPDIAQEGADYVAIAKHYAAMQLATPSDSVLQRVQDNARHYTKKNTATAIFENIKALFMGRRLVVALSLLAVVGLNYAMSHVQNSTLGDTGLSTVAGTQDSFSSDLTNLSATRAALPDVTTAPLDATLIDAPTQEFNKGRAAFDAGQYAETQEIFSNLMSEYPAFEKRKEVYTYWIETLKKLGRYDLAEKKQKLLEEIENE